MYQQEEARLYWAWVSASTKRRRCSFEAELHPALLFIAVFTEVRHVTPPLLCSVAEKRKQTKERVEHKKMHTDSGKHNEFLNVTSFVPLTEANTEHSWILRSVFFCIFKAKKENVILRLLLHI